MNSGIARSGKILGLPNNTEAITDEMLRAVAKRDLRTLIAAVDDERLVFLRGLKTWPVFGAGWARRVAEVRAAALRMADVAPKEKVPSTSAPKVTAGTIAVAGAAAQQAHSAGVEPAIIAVIVVVAIAIAIAIALACGGWFAWRWHQRQRPQND